LTLAKTIKSSIQPAVSAELINTCLTDIWRLNWNLPIMGFCRTSRTTIVVLYLSTSSRALAPLLVKPLCCRSSAGHKKPLVSHS